ncbi:lysis system i-spanin subunit Rz [Pseudomonas sp. 681]|uniref:Lysis system i-spanin subunit Rz n=1 Tax=Pseudomonas fungipugnans TaxID=3024217 RepID=A0ABT6QGP4_9PSED|nr:lysis system i-spanin subunit Rz [Pseudomonas sp. 681]MDI2590044.1 lysis system i-spanin subunit Rz [Pseudomonas sp. 681]
MSLLSWKLAGLLVVVLVTAAGTWQVQEWRYGNQLAEQARLHTETLNQLAVATRTQQQAEQDKRLALEQRLTASDQTHHKELTDAQTNQARLRDRLATADLRLSVLLDAADSASGCSMPATPSAGGVVHGGARARLDPAHAQRIIAITDDGDDGMIALAACQSYAQSLSR